MRITNNIILHNTSININGNKGNVDTLNNQMTSQKKIQRPSDDPVTAIRALRLRSTLSEIDQYYEKNIPDAESWLSVTETAISSMQDVIKTIRTQCEYGAQDSLTTDNRKTILTQLEKLRDKVYSEGNADYAGRTVFTGYRTNKKLTFTEDEQKTAYEITQNMSYSDLQEHRYYGNDVIVPGNQTDVKDKTKIASPTQAAYNRIRLGYDGIDSLDTTDATGTTNKISANGAKTAVSYHYTDAAGTKQTGNMNVTDMRMFEEQTKIIQELAKQAPGVFLGRCANFVLGDQPHSYSFFVYADDEYREKEGKEYYKGQTLNELKLRDIQRNEYYQRFTGMKRDDPKHYDMVVNVSKTGVDGAVKMILDYVEQKESGSK